jgi:hypothetical protein
MEKPTVQSTDARLPTILIPYPGPCGHPGCHDVFVYLRPETNGVRVESTMLRVVHTHIQYKERMKLAYLANVPGDFIVEKRIIEQHYVSELYFAVNGKSALTEGMRKRFEQHFDTSFSEADIIGAFEAMKVFDLTYNELFNLWVPPSDMLKVSGQTLKKYKNTYIINYDIPAILHKNNNKTDIAVMILRADLTYGDIHKIVDAMGKALIREHILDPGKPLSRIFHYSKGPFGQIRDAIGYLYTEDIRHVPLKSIAFADYLLKKGVNMHQILEAINNPIMQFRGEDGSVIEDELFHYTADDSFEEAYKKFCSIISRMIVQ